MDMKQNRCWDDAYFSIVRVFGRGLDGSPTVSGTGSIVEMNGDEPTRQQRSFLICNQSLVHAAKGKIELGFLLQERHGTRWAEDGEIIEQTASELDVYGLDAELYLEHPLTSIDLACIDISFFTSGYYPVDDYGVFYRAVNPDCFAGNSNFPLSAEQFLSVVGYPHRFSSFNDLPIERIIEQSNLSHLPRDARTPFEVKAPLLNGLGGGPVLVESSDGYRLIGILSSPSGVTDNDAGVCKVIPIEALENLLSLAMARASTSMSVRKRLEPKEKPHSALDYAKFMYR